MAVSKICQKVLILDFLGNSGNDEKQFRVHNDKFFRD